MRASVYVEVFATQLSWYADGRRRDHPVPVEAAVGRTWKRRPSAGQLRPGAICVQVDIDVPSDRLDHHVVAAVPQARPLALGKGEDQ